MKPESPSSPPRRAEAKQKTRRALVRAAREAFTEQGLWSPSLDAICEQAGFTRGAFYVHFASREDLVAAVMEESLREVIDGVIAAGGTGGDLEATIDRYVAVAELMRRGPLREGGVRFHQLLEAGHRTPRIGRLLSGLLQDAGRRLEIAVRAARDAGRATDRVEPRELASLLLLLALGVMVADEVDLPVDLGSARDALLRLISPP